MTYIYSAVVQAAFNSNTDTLAIEIQAPANKTIKIRRIRLIHDDGTAAASADYHRKLKIVTESVAGSGGTSYTPVAHDANANTSACTVNTGSFTIGTINQTIDINSVHSAIDFLWQAETEEDKIVISPGGIFGVIVNPAQ